MPEKEIHAKLSMAMKMSLKSLFQAVISLATALPPHSHSIAERNRQKRYNTAKKGKRIPRKEIERKLTTTKKMTLKHSSQALISLATTLLPHSHSKVQRNGQRRYKRMKNGMEVPSKEMDTK